MLTTPSRHPSFFRHLFSFIGLGMLLSQGALCARGAGENFLKDGQQVLPPPGPGMFVTESPKAQIEWLPADGSPDAIMRVTTEGPRPKHDYDIQLNAHPKSGFDRSDVIFLRLKVRCLRTEAENGIGRLSPLVELREMPFTKTLWVRGGFPATAEWRTFSTAGRFSKAYAPDTLKLSLRLGYAPQVLEFKDIELWRLPPETKLSALPASRPDPYAGIEPDAAWRQEARERIERIRKQAVNIRVTDADGNPVPGATVRLEQTRHAFGFGTAVSVREMLGYAILPGDSQQTKYTEKPSDVAMYQSVLLNNFDACGTENDLKWPNWAESHLRTRTLHGLEWLQANGFKNIRGHVLLWPSFYTSRTPAFVQNYKHDPAQLRQVIMDHIQDELTATAPYVNEWDVINEPRLNHEILDLLGGESFMVDVFEEARRWLPQGRLFLNEALTFTPGERVDELERMANFLIDEGAPLDGLGIQCHYSGWAVTPPLQILETLDRLAVLGKDIKVTEFDIDSPDDQFQAQYLRDFYTAVFSHPSATGIQLWGFWAGRHWNATAALWSLDWQIRPAGRAYLDLVRGEWWTQTSGQTDSDGTWSARGFKGDYRITTLIGERVVDVREVSLEDAPLSVSVQR